MEIRDATPADAAAVAAVARASWHAAYDDVLGRSVVDDTVDEWYDVDDLREQLRAIDEGEAPESEMVLLATRHGDVVGFTHVGPAADDHPRDDAFVPRLYVHPDHWGEGFGRALTARAARRLREAGHETIWLEVLAENDPGRRFYERAGFERFDSVEETVGGETVTTLHMEAPLTALVDLDGD